MTGYMQQSPVSSSRLIAWGGVAAMHVLFGVLLLNGMSTKEWVLPAEPINVVMLREPMPPPAEPPQPTVPEIAQVRDIFVPAPEVEIARSVPSPVAVTNVPPPAAEVMQVATFIPPSDTSSIIVVTESEVDYLVKPQVHYPTAAKRAGEQGTVVLAVWVDVRGCVEKIAVHLSSGYARLDDAAVRAVRALKVRPYQRNGVALPVQIRIPVEFFPTRAV